MVMVIVKRLLVGLVTLFGISIALFALTRAIPGDPVSLYFDPQTFTGDRAAAIARLRSELGLDQSLPHQYLAWAWQALHGNFGYSITSGRTVTDLMASRLGPTAYLMLSSLVISLLLGIFGGVFAALRKNTVVDYGILLASLVVLSIPSFFLAMLGIYVFGLKLQILPTAGLNSPSGTWGGAALHLVLPATILGLMGAGNYVRWVRSSMLDVLDHDFMVTARSKGLSRRRVVVRHGLRNALIPLVTVVAIAIPSLLGGAVIIEKIFAWPGTGRMAVEATSNRDYSVLLGFLVLTAVLVLLCNLIADIAYAVLDPRIRL